MRTETMLATTLGVVLLVIAPGVSGLAFGTGNPATPPRDQWSATEVGVLASLRLSQLPPTPLDPSNAFEASPAAIDFGRLLFNDKRFSQNQAVSCASCHDAKKQFQDGLPVGKGVGTGTRRTMPIVGSGHSPWLFWDGRKDSLWAQALGPLEDAAEHGGNRTRYAQLIQTHYRTTYEGVFGTMPDVARAPSDASPGGTPAEKAAWKAMDASARQDVNRVFANMGKAIAAFEKTLTHGETRFDRYVEGVVRGDPGAQRSLNPQEVDGLRIFVGKGQCVTCHNGPLFTDQSFHNTGVPPRDAGKPDLGRAAAIAKVQADEFNCLGPFSDAKASQCQELRFLTTDDPSLVGAFKTPSLRDVSLRPPYMHAGQFASLEDAIAHYVRAPAAVVGHTELAHGAPGHTERKPIRLTEKEIKALATFLGTLSNPLIAGATK
ncbi:MAG: cytochrome c peroxidase [Burkholderiaceae bacterium]|nr:cytochrome c peroxidase [Burkholderiaceae bacterium]